MRSLAPQPCAGAPRSVWVPLCPCPPNGRNGKSRSPSFSHNYRWVLPLIGPINPPTHPYPSSHTLLPDTAPPGRHTFPTDTRPNVWHCWTLRLRTAHASFPIRHSLRARGPPSCPLLIGSRAPHSAALCTTSFGATQAVLKGPKFACVDSLLLMVQDNQGDMETTRLAQLYFMGTPLEKK